MDVLSSIAIIILAVEAFFVALVPLVLAGALVYGLWWLRRHENLPSWLALAREYVKLASAYVELAMVTVVQPILFLHRVVATVEGWLRGIARLGGSR